MSSRDILWLEIHLIFHGRWPLNILHPLGNVLIVSIHRVSAPLSTICVQLLLHGTVHSLVVQYTRGHEKSIPSSNTLNKASCTVSRIQRAWFLLHSITYLKPRWVADGQHSWRQPVLEIADGNTTGSPQNEKIILMFFLSTGLENIVLCEDAFWSILNFSFLNAKGSIDRHGPAARSGFYVVPVWAQRALTAAIDKLQVHVNKFFPPVTSSSHHLSRKYLLLRRCPCAVHSYSPRTNSSLSACSAALYLLYIHSYKESN